MTTPLQFSQSIHIQATPSTIWTILIRPHHIIQWEDIPADWSDMTDLKLGSTITWRDDTGTAFVIATVSSYTPETYLEIAPREVAWADLPISAEDFHYSYTLHPEADGTRLTFHMGDFSKIPDGQTHYQAASTGENTELLKIKTLAETQPV